MTFFAGMVLAAIVTIVPLHLFYWWVVRPAVLGMLQVRLWRLQHEIVAVGEECTGEMHDERAVLTRFSHHCERLAAHLEDVDVVDVIKAIHTENPLVEQVEADMKLPIHGRAPCPVVASAMNMFVAAILVNSPAFVPVFAVVYTLAIWLPKAREQVARFNRGVLATACGAVPFPA